MSKYKKINQYAEPIFCPDCKTHNTFERNPKKDIYFEGGTLGWKSYVCRLCGYKTIVPIKEVDNGTEKAN